MKEKRVRGPNPLPFILNLVPTSNANKNFCFFLHSPSQGGELRGGLSMSLKESDNLAQRSAAPPLEGSSPLITPFL